MKIRKKRTIAPAFKFLMYFFAIPTKHLSNYILVYENLRYNRFV